MTIDDWAEQLKQLVRIGKTKGYVLYNEIDELLPANYRGGGELDDILSELTLNGIEVLDEPRDERGKGFNENIESFDKDELQELGREGDEAVKMYLLQVLAIPQLTPAQELGLVKRIRSDEHNREDAERQLFEANLRLVVPIAKRYRNADRGLLELLQEGNVGLMWAVKKFDYTRGLSSPHMRSGGYGKL